MNIIITGSNGFIGQHLIQFLKQKFPASNISCLVRKVRKPQNSCEVSCHCVDYSDLASLQNLEILKSADYIFHLAGVTKGISMEDFVNGNVIPTKNLLEAVLGIYNENPKFKRFVFISSLAAGGPAKCLENPKKEADADQPVEFYGESKLLAENIVAEYGKFIPTTIIRPSAVYGPGDLDFLNIFKMLNKNLSIFHGNKNDFMSLIFAKDLAEGIVQAALSDETIGRTYYLTHPQKISWLEFHKISAEILGKKPIEINVPKFCLDLLAIFGEIYSKICKKNCIFNKQKIKMAKYKYWICSDEKAAKDFGFVAKTDLKSGLEKTLDWCRRNRKI